MVVVYMELLGLMRSPLRQEIGAVVRFSVDVADQNVADALQPCQKRPNVLEEGRVRLPKYHLDRSGAVGLDDDTVGVDAHPVEGELDPVLDGPELCVEGSLHPDAGGEPDDPVAPVVSNDPSGARVSRVTERAAVHVQLQPAWWWEFPGHEFPGRAPIRRAGGGVYVADGRRKDKRDGCGAEAREVTGRKSDGHGCTDKN